MLKKKHGWGEQTTTTWWNLFTRIWWPLFFMKVHKFSIRKIKWSYCPQNIAKYQGIIEYQVKIFSPPYLHWQWCWPRVIFKWTCGLGQHNEVRLALKHDNAINVHHRFIWKTEMACHMYHKMECYALWHAHLLTHLIKAGRRGGGISDKLASEAFWGCRKSGRRAICNTFLKECNKRRNVSELFREWPLYKNHPYVRQNRISSQNDTIPCHDNIIGYC